MKNRTKSFLFILILSCIVILSMSTVLFVGCDDTSNQEYKSEFDKIENSFVNLNDFASIGVGVLADFETQTSLQDSSSSKRKPHIAYAYGNHKKHRLVGVKHNGEADDVKYSKDDDNLVPDLDLIKFIQTSRYILVNYTSETEISYQTINFRNDGMAKTYLIDKETNLVFNLAFDDYEISYDSDDFGDKILVSLSRGYYTTSNDERFTSGSFFEVGVKDGVLQVNEIFHSEKNTNRLNIGFFDIYRNAFVIDGYAYDANCYIWKCNGELVPVDLPLHNNEEPVYTNIHKGIDGCIYYYNDDYINESCIKKLNEDGEFVDVDYFPGSFIPSEYLIYSTEYIDYYFYGDSTVIKIEKSNGKYNHTDINVGSGAVRIGTVFFGIKDKNIVKTDILSGVTSVIEFDRFLLLSFISEHGSDGIEFEGTDNKLNKVKGVITVDGEISYEYYPPKYAQFSVLPITNRNR